MGEWVTLQHRKLLAIMASIVLFLGEGSLSPIGAQTSKPKHYSSRLTVPIFKINFATNVSKLDSDQEALIASVISSLSSWDASGFYILLEGRADARGSSLYNEALSQLRIDNVEEALKNIGYRGSVRTRAFGEQQPIILDDPIAPQNRSVTATLVCSEGQLEACLCFQRRVSRSISNQDDVLRDAVPIIIRLRDVSIATPGQCPIRLYLESRHFDFSTWEERISSDNIPFPNNQAWPDQVIWSGDIHEGDELLVLGYNSTLFCASESVVAESFTFNLKMMKFDGTLAPVITAGRGLNFIPNTDNNFRYSARMGQCEFDLRLEVNMIGGEYKERLITQ
jgi:hypothetical protein